MKFLPTDQQITDAIVEQSMEIDMPKAKDLEVMENFTSIIRLHNATITSINSYGAPSKYWRAALILAMRVRWILREHAGAAIALEQFLGITEAEMEQVKQEIRHEQS
jgi:hypothetical protein